MSRNFVRAEALDRSELDPFSKLLPAVDAPTPNEQERARLGRTAEGLQKLRDEAKEEGREVGYVEGFEAGRAEGAAEVREELRQHVADFREALDLAAERIEGRVAQWYREAEAGLAPLAAAIACRILGRELQVSADSITELTREAVREIASMDKVRIRVNPFDAAILRGNRDFVLAANPSLRGVEVVDDPQVLAGAIVESDAGLIDAAVRTQLELAFNALRRVA